MLAEVCFDCFILCFVMGYVLQFGEIAHKTVHYKKIFEKRKMNDESPLMIIECWAFRV